MKFATGPKRNFARHCISQSYTGPGCTVNNTACLAAASHVITETIKNPIEHGITNEPYTVAPVKLTVRIVIICKIYTFSTRSKVVAVCGYYIVLLLSWRRTNAVALRFSTISCALVVFFFFNPSAFLFVFIA